MNYTHIIKNSMIAVAAVTTLFLAFPRDAAAHCDTLDGPVVQDARKAIDTKDITPILKWVKPKDEKAVRAAYQKVISSKSKSSEESEHKFFAALVKIHRAGEGAPFAGLKPAGAVEPAVAEADKALASGSTDSLVKLITDDIAAGIRSRFELAATAYLHKDESVAQGREFVEAYVAYTHYVERLHNDATAKGAHVEHGNVDKHSKHKKESDHSKH